MTIETPGIVTVDNVDYAVIKAGGWLVPRRLSKVFFDSWGLAWERCSPEDQGAQAFGPTGTARRVFREEFFWGPGARILDTSPHSHHDTPWTCALRQGRAWRDTVTGWGWLVHGEWLENDEYDPEVRRYENGIVMIRGLGYFAQEGRKLTLHDDTKLVLGLDGDGTVQLGDLVLGQLNHKI